MNKQETIRRMKLFLFDLDGTLYLGEQLYPFTTELLRRIRETAEKAVREGIANPDKFKVELPNKFDVEVEFKHHSKARRASFYPGVKKISDTKVLFSSDAYYEVLRFFMFCL